MDTIGELLFPNQWFDFIDEFINGYAKVKLNKKWNFIDTKGTLMSPKQWFDDTGDFYDGYAKVKLNGLMHFRLAGAAGGKEPQVMRECLM